LLEDDADGAILVSTRVSDGVQWIRSRLEGDFAGKILFAAGDEVLALLGRIPSIIEIDEIRTGFESRTGLSVSCGLGASTRDASSNLRLAKLRGENRAVGAYDD
jgi:hypothetical protein